MAKNTEITAFDTFDRIDKAKEKLDSKIEKKVSYEVFFWILLILVGIASGVLAYAFNEIEETNKSIVALRDRVTKVETQAELQKR